MLNEKYKITKGDTFNLIKSLDDNSIDLLITSPPYNVGKVYEKEIDFHTYLNPYVEFAKIAFKKIAPRGSICWEVGNYVKDGEVYPLDIYFYDIFKDAGFKLRNRIIWHFEHGLHASKRFSGRYETILWFTKSDNYTFHLDPVRIPAKYPGKRHFKGPHRGQLSGNPLGKNPSDLWEFLQQEWETGVWDIPNVKANHIEKTIHPCQFPVELVERCVLALTNDNDRVLDPYSGVGSSLLAALMHGRKAIGVEKEEEYIAISKERIYQ